MLSTSLVTLALAGQALSAVVPNQFVKRQAESASSTASEVASSASAAPSAASSAASSAAGSVSGSASAAAPSATTSQSPGQGLVSALNSLGLTSLASLIEPIGDDLASQLQDGNYTVFTPTNDAISNASLNTSDTEAVQQVLSYHILPAAYPVAEIPSNETHVIAETLEGTPLSFYKDMYGTTRLIGQDTYVITNRTYENLLLKWVDSVLEVPGPIPEVLNTTAGTTGLVSLLGQYLPDVVSTLNDTGSQYTVFAPTNEAVSEVSSTLGQVAQSDQEALTQAVQGHVLDQVVYSTNITDGQSATTLNGQDLTLSVNDTGVFVSSNGAEAQVVATDYIASNGVVHLINSVLFSGGAAASGSASDSGSAAQSASATASSASASASA